jgi:septum formation protein
MPNLLPIVLASRSPRRIELLRMIVPPERILIRPPLSSEEAGFQGLTSLPQIFRRLLEIAQHKHDQTLDLLKQDQQPFAALIAGDTTVVANALEQPVVLGQPPEGPGRNDLVREWFRQYYAGREHQVLTGVCLSVDRPEGLATKAFVVTSTVRFHADVDRWLEWYLATGESAGKAGGYAIQGAGSLFVDQVTGSLSNVVGLPIREVLDALQELGLNVDRGIS